MIFLFIILCILLILCYLLNNRDIINPVFLCCAAFMLSWMAAFYNVETWAIELSATTISLIGFSLLAMIIGGTFILLLQREVHGNSLYIRETDVIKVENYKLLIILVLGLVTAFSYINDVIRVARVYGYGSGSGLSSLMSVYRFASHFTEADVDNRISRLSSYLMDLFRASAYIITYIGIHNLVVSDTKSERKKNRKYFLVTALFCVVILLSSSRMQILKMAVFIMIEYFLLLRRYKGWNKRIRLSTIVKIIGASFVVVSIFIAVRGLVGRATSADPLYYATIYIGGSIEGLDLFIKDPISPSNIWGKESFYAFYNFIGRRFGIGEYNFLYAKEFRGANGITIGNIYTALRCFYNDFGYLGTIICAAIVGMVFTYLYSKIKYGRSHNDIDMDIILYGYISYSYCFFSINYYFDYLTPSFVKMIMFFLAIRWFICSFSVSFKRIRIR